MKRRLATGFGEAVAATVIALAETTGRLLDALLGPRCAYGCGQRLYPRDRAFHEHYDHAGDTPRFIARIPDNPEEIQ